MIFQLEKIGVPYTLTKYIPYLYMQNPALFSHTYVKAETWLNY